MFKLGVAVCVELLQSCLKFELTGTLIDFLVEIYEALLECLVFLEVDFELW